MIDYGTVHSRIDEFLQTRNGLSNPKKAQDYRVFVKELTGIFCGAAYENDLTTNSITEFLDLVQVHYIEGVTNTGKISSVCQLISEDIRNHPLYYITEYTLMVYKPASVQVGPGEFFFCFYDAASTFGIDNTAGFDIIVDGHTTELKKINSNLTTPELFDKYAANPQLSRLMVVMPVSDSTKPRFRSRYACIDVDNWRKVFYHRNGKTLAIKEAA